MSIRTRVRKVDLAREREKTRVLVFDKYVMRNNDAVLVESVTAYVDIPSWSTDEYDAYDIAAAWHVPCAHGTYHVGLNRFFEPVYIHVHG